MIVVVDGPDGVGKTTLCHGLVGSLSKAGRTASYLRCSEGLSPFGKFVYSLRMDRALGISWGQPQADARTLVRSDIDALTFEAMNVSSHVNTLVNDLPQLAARHEVIVLDRGWGSTYASIRAHSDAAKAELFTSAEFSFWRDLGDDIQVVLLDRQDCLKPDDLSPDEFTRLRGYFREAYSRFPPPNLLHLLETDGGDASDTLTAALGALGVCHART